MRAGGSGVERSGTRTGDRDIVVHTSVGNPDGPKEGAVHPDRCHRPGGLVNDGNAHGDVQLSGLLHAGQWRWKIS